MTKEENIATLNEHLDHWKRLLSEKICDQDEGEKTIDALQNAIKALEQEPCADMVSRQAVNELVDELARAISDERCCISRGRSTATIMRDIRHLPPVTPQPKKRHCKDCKYFENDSWAKVDGIPLIVAHKICKRWGNGCQTKEDGYCFLFESKKQEGEG